MIHFISPALILTSVSCVSLYFLASSQSYCPRLGSLCRVRVCLKSAEKKQKETESVTCEKGSEMLSVQLDQPVNDITEAMATAFTRCRESVIQVPLGDWTVLRLGEGQCDITEACLERMRAGGKCEVRF